MNRIRKINRIYQVLITPSIKISPDSSLIIGNWEDEELRNYHVIEFPSLQEAQCEAFQYPDIDWYRIIINHKYIFERLKTSLEEIIKNQNFEVEFIPNLMTPNDFKNIIFDRVINNGERFSFRHGANDIISFTIINPWTNNLKKIAKIIERHREHLYRDDLRIRSKMIIDDIIICLYGYTEFGTIYEIRLIPSLLFQYSKWYLKYGLKNVEYADKLYRKYLDMQQILDQSPLR